MSLSATVICNALMLDTVTGQRLSAGLYTRLSCGPDYSVSVGEEGWISVRVQNEMRVPGLYLQKYPVAEVDGLWSRDDGMVLAISFRRPAHQVVARVAEKEVAKVRAFVTCMLMLKESVQEEVPMNTGYAPSVDVYLTPETFDRRDVDFGCVSELVLEQCSVPRLTVGPACVTYISLSDSQLGADRDDVRYGRFFDWMTSGAVVFSLRALKLDGCRLDMLPFELVYLSALETLSVARNELEVLPQFLGELKNLKNLYVNENYLRFLPGSLKAIQFLNFSGSKNDFYSNKIKNHTCVVSRKDERDISNNPCLTLAQASFLSIFNNHIILGREQLPRSMWLLFDELKRCSACKKLSIAECFEVFQWGLVKTVNLSDTSDIIWQTFECKYKCSPVLDNWDFNFCPEGVQNFTLSRRLQQSQSLSLRKI